MAGLIFWGQIGGYPPEDNENGSLGHDELICHM